MSPVLALCDTCGLTSDYNIARFIVLNRFDSVYALLERGHAGVMDIFRNALPHGPAPEPPHNERRREAERDDGTLASCCAPTLSALSSFDDAKEQPSPLSCSRWPRRQSASPP